MKILIIGITGMLGSTLFRTWCNETDHEVWGTLRSPDKKAFFTDKEQKRIVSNIDVNQPALVYEVIEQLRPDVVINCTGIIKQLDNADDPLTVLPVNSLFPHLLARFCNKYLIRVIHISTDCVFSGAKGDYQETDVSDATDLYGRSKHHGELLQYSNAVTLRTSLIGHELDSSMSLIDWFLSQKEQVSGFAKAFFSGLTTIEIARVLDQYVLSNKSLTGLYHLSSYPISKFDLLSLVARRYHHNIPIKKETKMVIDRSLNSARFQQISSYRPPTWPIMIDKLFEYYQQYYV